MADSNYSHIISNNLYTDSEAVFKENCRAAKAISEAISSTLGPNGMDKMLISPGGKVTISNDGVTILEEMKVEHPTAKLLISASNVQEKYAGDGTSSAILIASSLLTQAQALAEQGIHPSVMVRGFEKSMELSLDILEEISIDIDRTKDNQLRNVAKTSMTGRATGINREHFIDLVIDAVRNVTQERGEGVKVDLDYAEVKFQTGIGAEKSTLVSGATLEKEPVHDEMAKAIDGATTALIDIPIEPDESSISIKINADDPEQIDDFLEFEDSSVYNKIDHLYNLGVDVIFCQREIDNRGVEHLHNKGMIAFEKITKGDLRYLQKVLDTPIITDIFAANERSVGKASISNDDKGLYYVNSTKGNGYGVTLLVRGKTSHVVKELSRGVEDALDAVAQTVADGKALPGGGATEIALSQKLRSRSYSIPGKQQMAIKAFADALEIIPSTIALNSGMDPIDTVLELRTNHDDDLGTSGINAMSRSIEDTLLAGIIDPLRTKEQVIKSATEAAVQILKMDTIISDEEFGIEEEENVPDMGASMGEFSPITTSPEYYQEPEQNVEDVDINQDQSETMRDIL